ncbi:conserved hypothetical protein, partial [Burkholderia pseudomallei Pakistan 9]
MGRPATAAQPRPDAGPAHEARARGYTHGEIEFIHPLYKAWVEHRMNVPAERVRFVVAWVTV